MHPSETPIIFSQLNEIIVIHIY